MCHHVVLYMVTNTSEEPTISILYLKISRLLLQTGNYHIPEDSNQISQSIKY